MTRPERSVPSSSRAYRELPEGTEGDGLAGQLPGDAALVDGVHAIADANQLLKLGGDHQGGETAGGERIDGGVDALLGADVHAASRLVEDRHPRLSQHPAGQQRLLL